MSKVQYEVNIGSYDEPVKVAIDIRIANGLTPEDYQTLRAACQTIEDTCLKYVPEPKDQPVTEEE